MTADLRAAATLAESVERRAAIYSRLYERNRLVRVLRIGLPVLGAIIFLGLVLQIYLGSLVPDLGFANVAIDRDNLVVEAPVYAGTGADGTTYALSAASARTAFGNTDIIDLVEPKFVFRQPGNATTFTAQAAQARLQISDQTVSAPGITTLLGDDGLRGTAMEARLDVAAERMHSEGPVDLTLPDGSNVIADTMNYDGTARRWTFGNATVSLVATPGEAGRQAPLSGPGAGGDDAP